MPTASIKKESPLVLLQPVTATPPSLGDNTGDIDRLRKAVFEYFPAQYITIPFFRLAEIAKRFRLANFSGVAVLNNLAGGLQLVDFLTDSSAIAPAMALDLGTTHLEARLVDLATGKIIAHANRENSQIEIGADILTRIHHAAKDDGLNSLKKAVVGDINLLAGDLAEQAGMAVAQIRALSVSGNTTMVHLFLGLDPYHLCREPYIPLINAPDPYHAVDLGLAIHPAAPVWIMPNVGSYFGGDLVAGIIASDLDNKDEVSMLIDVGTNAEVIVGNREWLIACAGAAGPALEGGVAKMGMRAGPGAIEHVEIDPDSGELTYQTIGGQPAKGICGSGIIDLVAALYLARVIDIRGKFRPSHGHGRLGETPQGLGFTVVQAIDAADNQAVIFGQIDLDAVMRSKAAMYSILTTLVNQVGVSFAQLDKIYVAGAFGRHIAPRQAIVLGMLPDLPLEKFQSIGNSSLDGAVRVLLSGTARRRCQELINKITYIELNVNQEFMIRFSGSRFIPHTDKDLFPSVPFFGG